MSIKEHPPQPREEDELRSGYSHKLHVPVLLESTLQALNPKEGESYLDLTAGYGGHARAILDKTKNFDQTTLVDRDDNAIKSLEALSNKGVRLIHSDFVSAAKQLIQEGKQFSLILVDLGVSSPQLDSNERGFSFTNNGPLDMRMDRSQSASAETLVNTASAEVLTRIIVSYGEEPRRFAQRIAKAIIEHRPIKTTEDLANLIKHEYRGGWKKTHPATRTFQALRIAVNDELRQVEELLPLLPRLLSREGRVGIISFHSLEDRLVKRFLKEQFESGYEAELGPVLKKPILGATDDVHNPRSRSATLRVAVKK